MKCLLCNFNSNEPSEMREHYIAFHKFDPMNVFFTKILQEVRNIFHGKRHVRYQEFLRTSKFKINHDFLKHYEMVRTLLKRSLLILQILVRL